MTPTYRSVAGGIAALAAFACASPAFSQPCGSGRDLLLTNGKIHTMDAGNQVVESARVIGDKFTAVGRGKLGGTRCTEVVDLKGRTAVPGLIDNHNHILLLGLRPGHDTRNEAAESIADVQQPVGARPKKLPAGGWHPPAGGFG